MKAESRIAESLRAAGDRKTGCEGVSAQWEERRGGAESRVTEMKSRLAEAEAEQERLSARPDEIAAQRHELADSLETAEASRQQAADALALAETALAEAEAAQREADAALAESREQQIVPKARVSGRETRRVVIEQISDKLGCARTGWRTCRGGRRGLAAGTRSARGPRPAPDSRADNIGPVNLRAEAEWRKCPRGLSPWSRGEDLVAAIEKLRAAINKLNRQGREQLLASFATVNEHFRELFKILFGGGTAELQLTESDDPLEAGLEILAQPPGKRLQSLSLLSGGEQALTALALIFAVFLTNPAPICVLDEVDAPLDDTNVARFCDLLREITAKTDTRFLVITHHRMTMARMDRLFGVTMEQRGISKLVSVDLQTAERIRDVAVA